MGDFDKLRSKTLNAPLHKCYVKFNSNATITKWGGGGLWIYVNNGYQIMKLTVIRGTCLFWLNIFVQLLHDLIVSEIRNAKEERDINQLNDYISDVIFSSKNWGKQCTNSKKAPSDNIIGSNLHNNVLVIENNTKVDISNNFMFSNHQNWTNQGPLSPKIFLIVFTDLPKL